MILLVRPHVSTVRYGALDHHYRIISFAGVPNILLRVLKVLHKTVRKSETNGRSGSSGRPGARKYRSGAVVLPGLWVDLHGPLRLTRDLYYSKHRVQRRDSNL